jgi:phage tail sheath protein FI
MCPPDGEPAEVPGRRPIAPAASSLTALVAPASLGPVDEPVRVTSAAQFEAAYGGLADSRLGSALNDFLANGGREALVVRSDNARRGVRALGRTPHDFQLVVVDPDLVQSRILGEVDALCEERRAFLIADATGEGAVPGDLVKVGARNAAVYFPSLCDEDGSERPVAPAVAGIYARNDVTRGVWRLAGGSTAVLVDGSQVAARLTDRDLDRLAARNVNALRTMADGRVMVWGTRTVSADPEERYINARRFLLFVEHSIEQGLQWAVSEPNDEQLWASVRADVTTFLTRLWRRGALPGARPHEAFSVRCDETSMTQDDIDAGRLVVLVGIATVRPAELVILRIAVHATGTG